jgi:hypothetical protein
MPSVSWRWTKTGYVLCSGTSNPATSESPRTTTSAAERRLLDVGDAEPKGVDPHGRAVLDRERAWAQLD